jgi:hypothetical protein
VTNRGDPPAGTVTTLFSDIEDPAALLSRLAGLPGTS